ncbi:MAG: ABC transporter ATP-binding protein [Bacilli bacterium]|nr:ABC transporter ATP-binding protein [Bacilli bacterium]
MKQIGGILKKFTFPILIAIALLWVQATCDLSLPDYTANIINIGIQEKGIDSTIPTVLTKDTYDIILSISEKKEEITNLYEKKSLSSFSKKEQEKYQKKYPLITSEELYFRKKITKEEKETLSHEFASMLLFIETLSNKENQSISSTTFPQIPGNSNLEVWQQLDQATKNQIMTHFKEQLQNYENSMLEQVAIETIKKEYQQIGINLDELQMDYIIHNGLIMVGIASLIMLVAISIGFIASRTAAKFAHDLRKKVVTKIMSFSNKEFTEFSTASLITRSTNDIQQIQMLFVMLLRIVVYSPILGIGALLKVMGNSMNWVIGLAIGLIMLIVMILFTFAMPKFKLIQKLVDRLNLVSREILTGIPVIRAFSTESHEEKRFDVANQELSKVNLFCNRVMGIMMPTMSFIMNGVAILIIWVGAKQVDLGTLQVGTLMAFITYTMQVIMSFLMLSMVSIALPRAWVSVKRIGEVLAKENSIQETESPEDFKKENRGIVEFKDVYFRYPDAEEDVLEDISFVATPGTTTAFIGSTGSGKSTLVNLIPRFFDVTGGKILIAGTDIRKVDIHALRDKIGYVPQKGNLFSGTIKSNILFGAEDQSEENMKKAAEIAQATEFIEAKEEKYESEISQGGTNVSGGQRQRLSIARAIATNPEIYIFDDSFSALDYKTDVNLRKALNEETTDATIFIVAQRISTIMHADQIIVLDKGHIVGKGTHEELLKTCEIYKEIALSQLKEEELHG